MNTSRVVSAIVAVAVLAVISAGLIGSVGATPILSASTTSSAGDGTAVPTETIGTAASSTTAETTSAPGATPTWDVSGSTNTTGTVTNTTDAVSNTTENTTSTVTNTTENVTSSTANTTENTTTSLTNTTENTTTDLTNTTENTTTDLANTTENTTSSVTNTTQSVVSATANGTGDGLIGPTNLTVNASITTNETLGIAGGAGGTATADSSATPSGSDASGAGSAIGSASRTGPRADTDPAEGGDKANNTPPGIPSGGAALGGLLVIGVSIAAASKQIAATTAAGQSQELAMVGRTARAHVAHTTSSVRSHLARLPRLLFPLGYSRHDDSDPLEHEVRQALFEAVERSPGANLSTLADQSDVSMSTVRHHLRILEEEHLVASERIRGKRRYFLRNESQPALVAALDDTATGSILHTLARTGPASVSDLADDLGRDPSTISHHVSRLEDDGLLTRERDGRSVQNSLSPVARRVLTQEARIQQRPVATE